MPTSEPGDTPRVDRSTSLRRGTTIRTNSGGAHTTRPVPRNLGGPSYFEPHDHFSTSREREVFALGAVLPAVAAARKAGASGDSADGRSIKSSNVGARSDGGMRSPRDDLREVGDPFDAAPDDTVSVTGMPTSLSPGPVIFEDKVLERGDIVQHAEKRRQQGSGNSKEDRKSVV